MARPVARAVRLPRAEAAATTGHRRLVRIAEVGALGRATSTRSFASRSAATGWRRCTSTTTSLRGRRARRASSAPRLRRPADRSAGQPLAEGISPVPAAPRHDDRRSRAIAAARDRPCRGQLSRHRHPSVHPFRPTSGRGERCGADSRWQTVSCGDNRLRRCAQPCWCLSACGDDGPSGDVAVAASASTAVATTSTTIASDDVDVDHHDSHVDHDIDHHSTTTSTVPATLPNPESPPADPRADVPLVELGTIEIPKIGVDKSMFEGITLTTLDHGPGHWPGTAMPGTAGQRRDRRAPCQPRQAVPTSRTTRARRRRDPDDRRRAIRLQGDRAPRSSTPTRCGSSTRPPTTPQRCSPAIRPARRKQRIVVHLAYAPNG